MARWSIPDFGRRIVALAGRLDWGLVLAIALAGFAAGPFLARPALPHQTDAELHVYRTAELNRLVAEGIPYPRWAANLYLGYGYPLFNYYAPLTYHLGGLIARLFPGVDIVTGTKSVFVLGLTVAAVGAYLFGRELFGSKGGILAAASFTFSPYVLFIDPHARGALAEHFAICLLPLAFYFLHRLLDTPSPSALLGSVLPLSAAVFSHNLLGLVAAGLLLAYWGWKVLVGDGRRNAVWGLLSFTLAAGLVAFFWIPALLEYEAVKLEVIGPGHFDYRENFCSLEELLASSRLLDWGAVGPQFRHNLGLAQWILAATGLVTGVGLGIGKGVVKKIGFFVASSALLIWLMLPVSSPIWRLIPLMPYLQFPWRLLGPTSLMLALCGASAVRWFPRGIPSRALTAAALGFVVVTALPLLYPPPWPANFGGTQATDIIQWERRSQALGTTSTGDFLPRTVEVIPSVAKTLVSSYESEGEVDKINRATVPSDAEVTVLSHSPVRDDVQVLSPRPFVLRFYTFHFPGWKAYVDGKEVAIEIGRPEGFMTVPVPAGLHRVTVRFESTPPRKLGWLVAGCSLAALIGILVVQPLGMKNRCPSPASRLRLHDAVWLGGMVLALVLFKAGVLDAQGWLYRQSPPGEVLVAQNTLDASFDDNIQLLGYDLPRTTVQPGGTISLVLYWRAQIDMEENYQSFVHIAEPLDVVWTQEDHLNPGGLPTSRWPTDKYVWDAYAIDVPTEMPPGQYSINVGLYSRAEGYRLTRVDEKGQPLGDAIVIGFVVVTD